MRQFSVDVSAIELGIISPVVACISGIDNSGETPPQIIARGKRFLNRSAAEFEDLFARPAISGFRDVTAKLGYPDLVPAGERLVNSFRKKGFTSYGPLVDAYNVVALENAAGIGLHDAQACGLSMWIGRSDGTPTIRPLFKPKLETIKSGDVVYGDAQGAFAWIGRRDVDSDDHKLDARTSLALIVILGNANTTLEHNQVVAKEIFDLICTFSPDAEMEMAERVSV